MLVSAALPATATRTDWGFAYLPSNDPTAVADGSLTVTEHTGVRVRRTVSSRYGVQEQPARGCRCFLLVLESRTGDADTAKGREALKNLGTVYETRLFPSGRFTCTCPGFAAGGRECKHGVALRELTAVGDLPSPQCNADADFGPAE